MLFRLCLQILGPYCTCDIQCTEKNTLCLSIHIKSTKLIIILTTQHLHVTF